MSSRIARSLLIALLPILWVGAAYAQANSNPGWTTGTVPTANDWNALWSGKVDATGGFSTNQTLTTPTLTSPTIPVIISPTPINFIINGVTVAFPGPTGPYVPVGGGTMTGTLNVAGGGVYQQNGYTVLNTFSGGSTTMVGQLAGASLPANDTETTAIGSACLTSMNVATRENTCVGWGGMRTLVSGAFNTGVGVNVMGLSTTDHDNSLLGVDVMRDALGSTNSAIGSAIMRDGTHNNSALLGYHVLTSNGLTGANTTDNAIVGYNGMGGSGITTASFNSGVGSNIGFNLTSGSNNFLGGFSAGENLTTGGANILIGAFAGLGLTTTGANVCVGTNACQTMTSGQQNTYVGTAGNSDSQGWVTTGAGNICIGFNCVVASPTINNQISIGNILYLNNNNTSVPGLFSCGTSPTVTATSNLKSGTVTPGSGSPTACTIAFAGAGYITWNRCRVTSQSAVTGFSYVYNRAGIVISAGASIGGDNIDYDCEGN